MTDELEITLAADLQPADRKAIRGGLWEYNKSRTTDHANGRFGVLVRDREGRVVGGAICDWVWGWVHVETLFIPEAHRRQGVGTRIMDLVEAEARRLGCRHIHLDTFSFQALPFYQKRQYHVFGVLDDYPGEHKRYFLRKTL